MFNSKWNENHKSLWHSQLEFDEKGFTGFQLVLNNRLKDILISNSIAFSEDISEHSNLIDDTRIVKMITISINDQSESKFWIYHDMAEYNIQKTHHVYEEAGYLSPTELNDRYLKNVCELLNM